MTKYLDSAGLEHLVSKIKSGSLGAVRQAGLIVPYAGATAPAGYLICDGASYSAEDYPELYTAIGNTYGGDDTTFNVPDLRGRVPLGNSDAYALGATGGEEEHVLTVEEMPSHDHALEGITNVTSEATDGYLMTGGYVKIKEYDGSPTPAGG
ncbi:MAG: tail fiber protein, partial [Eggerthellaceae bacterium]|nr:tail fiber protein [Eggerthellaceae bacterium]